MTPALATLGALLAALETKIFGDHGLAVLGGITIVAFFAVSLAIDVRPKWPEP